MRSRTFFLAVLAAMVTSLPTISLAEDYTVDGSHTTVLFHVRHLCTKVTARFDRIEGTISFDPAKPDATKVSGSIDATSIDTNNEKRDTHLRSKDFFDVLKFPKITFVSTKISDFDATQKSGKLHGNLTIRGVEKPVVLDIEFLGEGTDPWGNAKAGFSAKTTIDRKDFGLTWNETLEAGGFLVGDEVEIEIAIEGNVES